MTRPMRLMALATGALFASGLAAAIALAQPASDDASTDVNPSTAPESAASAATPDHPLHTVHPSRAQPSPAPPPTATALPGARLAPGTPIPPVELEAFVDGVVRQSMLDDHIPGAAVAVVQTGQPAFEKGYGFADLAAGRPVDPAATLFRIGSISKTFTWIAVMKAVERGRIRMDGPINLYLPEKAQVKDQGFSEPVRVADLMSHSPGFEDRTLGRLFERDPGRVRSLETYLRQERPKRVAAPGLRTEYSNYGAALAGEAAVQAEGRGFEDLMETEILRPLNLNHTSFREPRPALSGLPYPMAPTLAADMATGYRWTARGVQARPFEYMGQIAPAGSGSSTAADMARYMSLILNGGVLEGVTLYSPQTALAFRTVQKTAAPGLNGWAHGFMQTRLPGGFDGFGHEGATLSFHSNLITVPSLNLGVFVVGNSETAARLAERLPALIVEHFYAPPATPAPGASDPAALRAAYAGNYLSEQRRYDGLETFISMLTSVAKVSVNDQGRLVIRTQDDVQTYGPEGPQGQFRADSLGQRTAFEIQDGRAVRWLPPSGMQSYARAAWWQQRLVMALAAAATLAASLATLAGVFLRDRREFRQTSTQRRASALQTTTSILWLAASGSFAVWAAGALADSGRAVFDWPGVWVLLASACALVAGLCSLGQLILLPNVLRGGRRLDSWSVPRKAAFTLTSLVFTSFAALLFMWGALSPWNN